MSINQRPKALPETEALIQQVIAEASCDLPLQGKEFTHYDSAFACVQRFAFANGFAVVETQYDAKQQRRVYSCVHHGKPANTRKITPNAVRKEIFNEMDVTRPVIQTRQVECKWAVTLTRLCYRKGPLKGDRMPEWTFKYRNLSHNNHDLEANPFVYHEHFSRHPGNSIAIHNATKNRSTGLSYRQHMRSQDNAASEKFMTESEYYNIGYDQFSINQNQPSHIISRMMTALQSADFHVRPRWTDIFEGTTHIRKLDQIFFVNDTQVRKARRFCTDFVLEIDATFSTNSTGMPLGNLDCAKLLYSILSGIQYTISFVNGIWHVISKHLSNVIE
ncbi:hypothetical protein K440DRAFT_638551 [Wilcoxina mikolae CBS 423.85]|nr:hypothetical protein K440DRAFT_638551 [Wilcoxina mikolae CBS 423.85]